MSDVVAVFAILAIVALVAIVFGKDFKGRGPGGELSVTNPKK